MNSNTQNDAFSNAYSLKEFALLTGKSTNLLYRRLTENPRRYTIRFARREGGRWIFDKKRVDESLAAGEPLIIPEQKIIDQETVFTYINGRFRSCGKDSI